MKKFIALALLGIIFAQPALAGLYAVVPSGGGGGTIAQGGTGATTASGALNQLYYNTDLQLPHWRAAIEGVQLGLRNATVLCVGDSTGTGITSTTSPVGNEKYVTSYCAQLTAKLNAAKITAITQNFMGGGTVGTTTGNSAYDNRLVFGTGWAQAAAGNGTKTLGGQLISTTTATNSLAFTPTVNVDTFVFYYPTIPSAGTLLYNVDGGSNTSINQNSTNSYNTVTISAGSLAPHTINFKCSSCGGGIFFAGVNAYDSTHSHVSVINAGWPGATVESFDDASVPWGPLSTTVRSAIAPDLVIIGLGPNNWNASTPLATFLTDLNTLVTFWQNSGSADVIIVTPNPSDPTHFASTAAQLSYVNQEYVSAAANSVPIVDVWSRQQPWSYCNTIGWCFNDVTNGSVHGTPIGYGDYAKSILQILAPGVGQ